MRKVRIAERIFYIQMEDVGIMILTDKDEKTPLRVVSIRDKRDFKGFFKEFQLKVDKHWEFKMIGGKVPDMREVGLSD